jgi:hypothetical protein
MQRLKFSATSVVVVLICAAQLFGQATLGVISGTVTDSSGAVVVGATVSTQRTGGGDHRSIALTH